MKKMDPEHYYPTEASREHHTVKNLEGRHFMKERARHDAPEDLEEQDSYFDVLTDLWILAKEAQLEVRRTLPLFNLRGRQQ